VKKVVAKQQSLFLRKDRSGYKTTSLVVVMVKVLNVTFNNISGISWRSDLLVEETAEPGENHRFVAIH